MQHRNWILSELKKDRIVSILEKLQTVRIGIMGDACLDIYWDADMRLSELSRETPHYPLPVIRERIYPGAGSNVAANVSSLKAGSVSMLSLLGKDWRRDCLLASLKESGIDIRFMLEDENWVTPAYCKPLRRGYSDVAYEDPRIDFENRGPLTEKQESNILNSLSALSAETDVLIVCDQFRYGVVNERVRAELGELAGEGKTVIVDSRSRIGLYRNVIIKPNEMEAIIASGSEQHMKEINLDSLAHAASKLFDQSKAPVVLTMGSKGALWYAGKEFYIANSIPVEPPIDIVGAGDTFLAAFSCAYGAGFSGPECIAFANLVSSIVIKKIGMTGTASPEEIIAQSDKILSS